jgi:D-3-phosphoglycerate dehydrogenase
VVLTDHPWRSLEIETAIFDEAGIDLIAGPIEAPGAAEVEQMIVEAEPDAILTCWAPVSAAAIERPKRLRVVARLGIGVDNIAVEAATRRGAWVTNVPDYCIGEVSDHAVALVLAFNRDVLEFDRAAKEGLWDPSRAKLQRLADLTIGIIGYGQIGRETARKLACFGCRILAHSRSLEQAPDPITVASLERITDEADVIILHLPLTPATEHLIDDEFLRRCRRQPLLVNVSRGALVDTQSVLRGLDQCLLRGVALDVIEGEPRPPVNLLKHPRAIITPRTFPFPRPHRSRS